MIESPRRTLPANYRCPYGHEQSAPGICLSCSRGRSAQDTHAPVLVTRVEPMITRHGLVGAVDTAQPAEQSITRNPSDWAGASTTCVDLQGGDWRGKVC